MFVSAEIGNLVDGRYLKENENENLKERMKMFLTSAFECSATVHAFLFPQDYFVKNCINFKVNICLIL